MGEYICKQCDKGLVSKIYKQLIQLNKKTNNSIKKWEIAKQTLLQRHTNDQQAHKKSTSLIIR